MVRVCNRCGCENQDNYDFCLNCGNQLNDNPEMLAPQLTAESKRKLIIVSYIVTIVLSWGGVVLNLLTTRFSMTYLGFFGVFMPFYLIQAPDSQVRKNGYIMLIISLIGVFLSFYLLFN